MKYEVTPEACRICLRKSRSVRSIFKPYDAEDMAPSEKLKLVSGVDIQDDEDFPALPQLICRSCEISLNMAFSFRNKARKSDRILHIYCNELNKDNIIVELATGRKFKLSKELTLTVVRNKNKQSISTSPLVNRDDLNISDMEEHFEESYLNDDEMDDVDEIEENEPIQEEEEEFLEDHREEDSIELNAEELLYSSDNNDDDNKNNYTTSILTTDDDATVKEEEKEQQAKPKQLYNAAEIAKRLDASDKYEVVSWKQEDDDSSVPVFRLRLKGAVTKHISNGFICEICGNTYRQKHRLMEHMRRHTNERRFRCEICNKCFAIAEGLRRHILTHGAHKPFKCNYCSRQFYNASARKSHEIVHSGAKPYVCNICGRAFAYTCSLRKHMLIHENKKLYRCDYCDKEFRLQHHLKQHEETQIHKDAITEHMNSQANPTLETAVV